MRIKSQHRLREINRRGEWVTKEATKDLNTSKATQVLFLCLEGLKQKN